MTRSEIRLSSCGTINGQLQFCVAEVLKLSFVMVAVRRFPKLSADWKATFLQACNEMGLKEKRICQKEINRVVQSAEPRYYPPEFLLLRIQST
jgi:hypothetical protein